MRTTSNKDTIYIGRNAGEEILEAIKQAKKSVKIVSPYLSADYLKVLVNLSKSGKEITLIACDKLNESSFSDFRISDIIKSKKIAIPESKEKRMKNLKIGGIILILSIISLVLGIFQSLLFILAGILLLSGVSFILYSIFTAHSKTEYSSIFRLKVFDSASIKKPGSTELIHSKIFIIDENVCFLGSVNFTFAGFKTHYETAIKVQDASALRAISEEVENLYNSSDLRAKELRELVRY